MAKQSTPHTHKSRWRYLGFAELAMVRSTLRTVAIWVGLVKVGSARDQNVRGVFVRRLGAAVVVRLLVGWALARVTGRVT